MVHALCERTSFSVALDRFYCSIYWDVLAILNIEFLYLEFVFISATSDIPVQGSH